LNLCARFIFDEEMKTCAIILSGSLDTQGILKLQKKIKEIVPIKKYDLIVDLTHVMYISSSGLGFLIYLQEYRKEHCFLSFPPDPILKTFKLLNLDEMFDYYHKPEELKEKFPISDRIIVEIRNELKIIRDTQYTMQWVKILRDYLAHEEMVKQMEKMAPYVLQADHSDSITLPSEEKYACILFKFLDRVLRKVANIPQTEIDDITIELIAKELMTNAVMHGYENQKNGIVEANYNFDGKRLEFSIIDYGKGFREKEKEGDRLPATGLKLIKKIFDELEITAAPKKKVSGLILGEGTMVKMVKNITQ
jgi:anti-anti-sigma factor